MKILIIDNKKPVIRLNSRSNRTEERISKTESGSENICTMELCHSDLPSRYYAEESILDR